MKIKIGANNNKLWDEEEEVGSIDWENVKMTFNDGKVLQIKLETDELLDGNYYSWENKKSEDNHIDSGTMK